MLFPVQPGSAKAPTEALPLLKKPKNADLLPLLSADRADLCLAYFYIISQNFHSVKKNRHEKMKPKFHHPPKIHLLDKEQDKKIYKIRTPKKRTFSGKKRR